VTETNDHDADLAVTDLDDDPVIADAVLPELAEFIALEGRAQGAGILRRGHAFAQKRSDASGDRRIKLAELPGGALGEFNLPRLAVC
jgi:hypothetical protein